MADFGAGCDRSLPFSEEIVNGTLLLASGFAGFVYGISPGPAVLALFGISAGQGRRAGATFLCGHLVGDALWSALALTAIIGAQAIGPVVFDTLGLICGAYLLWLGWSALTVRRGADGTIDTSVRRPLLRGLLFGVSNPKGYPVAVATFTALLTSYADSLTWSELPALVAAACLGAAAPMSSWSASPAPRRCAASTAGTRSGSSAPPACCSSASPCMRCWRVDHRLRRPPQLESSIPCPFR